MNTGILAFNQFSGRLRISVSHECQLKCVFCHREAIDDHWQPVYIDTEFFSNLIEAFRQLGGKEVNLTGGEPTLHPNIGNLVDIASNGNWKLALCTNGMRLDRVFDNIRSSKIDQIKLSVHEVDNSKGKPFLGKAYNFNVIERNILTALNIGANITINFTHTRSNTDAFRKVIEKVIKWDTNFLIIDLITTRWNKDLNGIGHISGLETEQILSEYASFVDLVEDRTGCVMKVFQSPTGKKWLIKDAKFGRLFTSMCNECDVKSECGEGVFVMRVDCNGFFKPCLLRKDLEKKLEINNSNTQIIKSHMENVAKVMFPDEYYQYL